MRIGLIGTGNLAMALGKAWAQGGHSLVVTGRNVEHARAAAASIGAAATSVEAKDLSDRADVFVLAVSPDGLDSALRLVGGPSGSLSGRTVVDCTNPIDYATGRSLMTQGSAAEHVARLASGAHVVKALHLFAGVSWPFVDEQHHSPIVAICGDDTDALNQTSALIQDLGGRAAVLGGLEAARQSEEVAGFVMRLVAAGANPRFAVPDVNPAG